MKCDCRKKLMAVLAVFVFKLIAGATLCGGIFSWVYSLAPTNVWRPVMHSKRLFVGLFLSSVLFVLVYKLLSKAFEGMGMLKKGLLYGACIWAAGIVPGMIAMNIFMTVNSKVIIYWTIMYLVLTSIQGVIVAFLLRDTNESCCLNKPAK